MQVKAELEQHWSTRLQLVRQSLQAVQAAQRSQVEAVVASIVARITDMAARDAKQQKKRRQLLEQVTELRAASEGESSKRRDVEQALQTASHLFKRELKEKNAQLEKLRSEVHSLRVAGWAGPAASLAVPFQVPALLGSPTPTSPLIAAGWGRPCSSPGLRPSGASAVAQAARTELALLRAARQEYQRALAEHWDLKVGM